jgi:hypothetical protein
MSRLLVELELIPAEVGANAKIYLPNGSERFVTLAKPVREEIERLMAEFEAADLRVAAMKKRNRDEINAKRRKVSIR